tara:strand:- start:6401 stop:9670 length:3270 start_codon:yes stop_codon:yes gene_type:complete
MLEVRDFAKVADFLLPRSTKVHAAILLISLLMIPGLLASLTPIDVNSYDMESPELTAYQVVNDEFEAAEKTHGFAVSVRQINEILSSSNAPHLKDNGEIDFANLPHPSERVDYQGKSAGLVGDEIPVGGILNLTVLHEIERKTEIARSHYLLNFTRPLVTELTGTGFIGPMSLPDLLRAFMAGESLLTQPTVNFLGMPQEPRTNWDDCGELECLTYDDSNITQAHIDLAAHRMIMYSDGAMLRWFSTDRGFTYDENSTLIGPIGGTIREDGTFDSDVTWGPGRWSASTTWILVQLSKTDLEENGITYSWADAKNERNGYQFSGLNLVTTPPDYTVDLCRENKEKGEESCSFEWAIIDLEKEMRTTDQLTVTFSINEGVNVELNRELLESSLLVIAMAIAITVLLWFSLRRSSDVIIVGATLIISLLWMQGSIGWMMVLGEKLSFKIISKSQFSNLLPILVIALGIDDSLHALHRYKEERRKGRSPESSAHSSLSRVGRAIMLTSLTTISAFAANLTSDIAALRSFGVEAALGVAAAFILTGIWAPLIRMDWDKYLSKKEKLPEEDNALIHMIKEDSLISIAHNSSKNASLLILFILIITAVSFPMMMSLEGDFKVEDFLDGESDFAQAVELANTRFSDEGEPAVVIIEGDMLDPRVYASLAVIRDNMANPSPNDPGKYTTTPLGSPEMHGIDELVKMAKASMSTNFTPFEEAGWESQSLECDKLSNGLPDEYDRDCLQFMYGFVYTHGIPAGGYVPAIPPSLSALNIAPSCDLNPELVHLCKDGTNPEYPRMTLRWGIANSEQFILVERVLAELELDMEPLQDLAAQDLSIRADIDSASEEFPVTWAIATGDPVTRYVAASSMQNQLQGTLVLGVLFCLITLWWGFRKVDYGLKDYSIKDLIISLPVIIAITSYIHITVSSNLALGIALFVVIGAGYWGTRALSTAIFTTIPIVIVIIWLYAIISIAGYGLNMVTVAIAAMSLGVGIDYVIHVVERYREERSTGANVETSIKAIGGAAGLALFGSAVSDVTGFLIISRSAMGFFASFGLFCAAMIALSLFASLVVTPAMLGAMSRIRNYNSQQVEGIGT